MLVIINGFVLRFLLEFTGVLVWFGFVFIFKYLFILESGSQGARASLNLIGIQG